MTTRHAPDEVLARVTAWAARRDAVRAVLLTGSRAGPPEAVDALSDYDVLLVVDDIHLFYDDRRWLDEFDRVLVGYWDPIHLATGYGIEKAGSVLLFEDGLGVDFTLWPVALMRRVAGADKLPAGLDTGYAVLLDKDGLTDGLKAPTHTAYVPAPPGDEIFQRTVQDFFSDVPYVAKCLRRDELLPAKWCLDYDMKHVFLRPMLEWRMECDRGWAAPAGVLGRGLKRRLPPDLWAEVERAYAGGGIEDNWEALFRTLAVFRRVAMEVAERLGYAYPLDMDEQVTAYARRVRLMPFSPPR